MYWTQLNVVCTCRFSATHCVTDSPGPCPASCSPAECGLAHQSPGSPSSPRTGTRLTAALDITCVYTKRTIFVRPSESAMKIVTSVNSNNKSKNSKKTEEKKKQQQKPQCDLICKCRSLMHICPNRTLWITAGWSGMEILAEKSARLF